jgi:hypothetical protein
MATEDGLVSAAKVAVGEGVRAFVYGEEVLLGHAHATAASVDARTQATNDAGWNGLLALDAAAVIASLDGRYSHGIPPHPSGLSVAAFSGLLVNAMNAVGNAAFPDFELGLGHASAHYGPKIAGINADALAGCVANVLYTGGLATFVAALDARYEAGTCTRPLGTDGNSLVALVTLLVRRMAEASTAALEANLGHGGAYGHSYAHSTKASDDSVIAANIAPVVAGIFAILDARYKDSHVE